MNDDVLNQWLEEDIGLGDFTTKAVVKNGLCKAKVHGGPGVLSGISQVRQLLDRYDLSYTTNFVDGDQIEGKTEIFDLKGFSHDILAIERLLLNILSHFSGISTLTARVVKVAKRTNSNLQILATRKTTPGLRKLEKEAVVHGGGSTHRMRLDDAILIKDNHLKLFPNISQAVNSSRDKYPGLMVEVEADNLEQAIDAVKAGADRVMLDNFTVEDAKFAYSKLKDISDVDIEISGGITLDNIAKFAPYADYISLSSLTMASIPVDFSLHVY